MADSHAFEITVRRSALPNLVQSINAQLARGTPQVAASELLALVQGRDGEDLRLSFVFPVDPALSALAADHPEQALSADTVALAHVFVGATARGADIDVCFFSTSHALAAAMRESFRVRDFFRSLAVHAVDARVREVNEWHESKPL